MRPTLAVAIATVLVCSTAAAVAVASHGTIGDSSSGLSHLANSPNPEATNSDIAFWGSLAYAGNYDGFRIIDVSNRRAPKVLSDFICKGAQNDVGVWDTGKRRLLFLSIDRRQTQPECSEPDPTRTAGWEGVRIFDVTDPANPFFVTAVATDCGSHTHTVVPQPSKRRVLLYVNSYPLTEHGADDPETGAGACLAPHAKLSVVEVPYDAPQNARVVSEPSVAPAVGCHDVGVFLELKIAAAACLTEGQIWDISDPVNPKITAHIYNPAVNIWHSGAWTWDGRYAIFGDEEGGAALTHGCTPPGTVPGATWFYDRRNPSQPAGSFEQKRAQLPEGDLICTTHNYNAVPKLGEYLLASAFYEAGTGVVDFTNVKAAREIAYFDAQNADGNGEAFTWSSYFYNGSIFANDIVRGVDIFRPLLSRIRGSRRYGHLNPQTQQLVLFEGSASNRCPTSTRSRSVRLRRGAATVRARVSQQGYSVQGATVRVSGPGFSRTARTNSRGAVAFRVKARRRGRATVSTPFCSGRLGVSAAQAGRGRVAPRFTG